MAGAAAAVKSGSANRPVAGLHGLRTDGKPAAKAAQAPVSGLQVDSGTTAKAHAPRAPGSVLYNQYNNASAGDVTSQNFEAANDAFDSEAADDFVVPAGQMWDITTVDAQGELTGAGPVVSFNVVFYSNNPATNLPQTVLASRPGSAFVNTSGDFTITLTSTVTLGSGTYWIGVQANEDSSSGQWFWHNRAVTSNQGAAWRNPGNGFGTGCTAFGRRATCLVGTDPDQVFKLTGFAIAAPDHTGTLASTDPTITDPGGRMTRNGVASTCAAPKAFPGKFGGAGFHYRTHTIKNANASPACVTVNFDVQTCAAGTNPLNVAAYTNSFNPADISQNYLADLGSSPGGSNVLAFSFTVPAGGKVVLVVSEVTANSGCPGYEFTANNPNVGLTFSQTFDGVAAPALPAGWSAANATGPAPLWATSATGGTLPPAADSAPNSAFVDDPAVISDKILTGPSLAIRTASAQLTFRQNRNLENGYDGGVLEISISGGAFQDILAAGGSFGSRGYNGTVSASFGNPLASRQAWTGNSSGWVFTTVNLPAAAAGHSVVLRWRMGSDSSVSAIGWRIDSIQLRDGGRLTVVKAGNGSGTVTSNPAGISCAATCTATYDVGTSVTLTAAPAVGTTFAGWTGSGCAGAGACVVAVNADKTVTATFTLQSRNLTVTKTGNGVGKVTSAPAGVSCPTACLASFLYGTSLTLTATPSAKAIFSGWSGDCTGTSKTCAVTMTADHAATAKFTAKCVVPKVVGKKLKKARARIKKAHCKVGKIKKKASTKKKKGRVLKQKPKPGKILKPNAKVNLVVGKGGL
jgi:uncharacterized repeat protein (TIGR02543 family)